MSSFPTLGCQSHRIMQINRNKRSKVACFVSYDWPECARALYLLSPLRRTQAIEPRSSNPRNVTCDPYVSHVEIDYSLEPLSPPLSSISRDMYVEIDNSLEPPLPPPLLSLVPRFFKRNELLQTQRAARYSPETYALKTQATPSAFAEPPPPPPSSCSW